MMRVFKEGTKVNFVDNNNVFVGYDLRQSCCETADWFIADKPITDKLSSYNGIDYNKFEQPNSIDGYNFDQEFLIDNSDSRPEKGRRMIFKLDNENGDSKYLHIFNIHNGYYGHGFEFEIDDETVEEGYL